jgi:Flp pilus assembly protein TadG
MVEFTLVALPFLLVTMGFIEFGAFNQTKAVMVNNAHDAARFAASNPGPASWSNAASPASGTIEYVAMRSAGGLSLVNNDAHITIAYYVPGVGAAPTKCGHYSQATNGFVSDATDPSTGSAYLIGACAVAGSLVSVTLTYSYAPVTPLPAMGTLQIVVTSTTVQEV